MEDNMNEIQKLIDEIMSSKAKNHISDDDFKLLIDMVHSIVESCETKEEAIEKLEALINDGEL